jgi:hypothetical protein
VTRTTSATGYLEHIGTKPNSRSAVVLIWIQATAAHIRIACEKGQQFARALLGDHVARLGGRPPDRPSRA